MRCSILSLGLVTLLWVTRAVAADPAPLRVLLVAGGCCHNYAAQVKILEEGIESRCHADVEVVLNPDKSAAARFPLYEKDDWAKGFDVVIHDECTANVADAVYVERILRAHREGVPAVALHCAMHLFRWGDYKKPVTAGGDNARWFEFIGVQSTGHGPKKTRLFATSLGHNNVTVADPRYLDLVVRGLLWSVGKIDAEGAPAAGYEKPVRQ